MTMYCGQFTLQGSPFAGHRLRSKCIYVSITTLPSTLFLHGPRTASSYCLHCNNITILFLYCPVTCIDEKILNEFLSQ
uniref:Uncharacterized protein n=1 Tax=Oryza brachyantha TaxID=4533 RepID=J3LPD0_ORYBR